MGRKESLHSFRAQTPIPNYLFLRQLFQHRNLKIDPSGDWKNVVSGLDGSLNNLTDFDAPGIPSGFVFWVLKGIMCPKAKPLSSNEVVLRSHIWWLRSAWSDRSGQIISSKKTQNLSFSSQKVVYSCTWIISRAIMFWSDKKLSILT